VWENESLVPYSHKEILKEENRIGVQEVRHRDKNPQGHDRKKERDQK